jgi:hypothetical protein
MVTRDIVAVQDIASRAGGVILQLGADAVTAISGLQAALRAHAEFQGAWPQLYMLDTNRSALRTELDALRAAGLHDHVLFYHGTLSRFRRDVPITPTLVCLHGGRDRGAIGTELHALSGLLATGTPIVCSAVGADAWSVIEPWLRRGTFEFMGARDDMILLHAGRRCRGRVRGLEPAVFQQVQNSLLVHYCHDEQSEELPGWERALTAAARHDGRRHDPHRGTSGRGPWPFAPVDAPLPLTLPDGSPWPRISIVTPSYNQGRYLEETMLSVLHQGYPNVEHIVIDGGSTDETAEVLERYRPHLAYVVSEKDRGQSHALNKGFARTTGDILTWLNSDDMLAPGALAAVALAFHTSGADMVAGICQLQRQGSIIDQHLTSGPNGPALLADMLDLDHGWNAGEFFYQPEVMFSRRLWEQAGARVDESYYYGMDYEMWLRFADQGARMQVIGRPVAIFRVHPDQKTSTMERAFKELVVARDKFLCTRNRTLQIVPPPVQPRQHLRFVLLDDVGFRDGAGRFRPNVVRALAAGGHSIAVGGLREGTPKPAAVFESVANQRPDFVLVGQLNDPQSHHALLEKIATHWPTVSLQQLAWTKPAVDVDVFRPRDRNACREALGLPMDRFLILAPPPVTPGQRAGIRHLAEALERLELPDLQVVVAGTAVADEVPATWICLHDLADDRHWANAFAAVDLFVDASPDGPSLQTLAEAAACATPVVAYATAASRELPDGIVGRLARAVDPAALADVFEELYGDPAQREELARWARVHAVSAWSAAAAYHHFHNELTACGLRDRIGLARKISIVQPRDCTAAPACLVDAWSEWQPVSGFGPWQPAQKLPAGRWAVAARSSLAVTTTHTGKHRLLLRCVNPHPEQRVRLLYQDQLVLECPLPTADGAEQTLSCTVELPAGPHHFELVCWQPAVLNSTGQTGALFISGVLFAPVANAQKLVRALPAALQKQAA